MDTKIAFLFVISMAMCMVPDSHAIRRIIQSKYKRLFHSYMTTTIPTTTTPDCKPTTGYDPSSNWCYGTFCDSHGNPQRWDNFNCVTTTIPPTTIPPTTYPPTTIPSRPGCYYHGHHYAPGTQIESGSDIVSNWCWYVFCDSSGQVLHGDNFNCFPTTYPPTTYPPTTYPPTTYPPTTFPTTVQQGLVGK